MVYVLEVYSYQSNKIHQMMFSENSIKLEKFVDLAREYHMNWNYCEQTFREFCTGRCSSDWLDDFGSLFLNLSSNLGKGDWWNELWVSKIELDTIQYF